MEQQFFALTGKHSLTCYWGMKRAPHPMNRDVFAAVGDATRRRVLDLLSRGELPVRRIAAPFAMSRPAISQHLRILLRARLVEMRRDGREHY